MASNSTSLIIQLSGTGINAFKTTDTWQPDTQIEQTISLVDTDGDVNIDFSEVNNVKTILLKSDSYFDLTIKMNVLIGSTVSEQTMIFNTNYFLLNPYSTTRGNITSLSISTTETTAILVDCRIYGVATST